MARWFLRGAMPPDDENAAAFAPKRTTKGLASGNLHIRHLLFLSGGLPRSEKPCGGRDCGIDKMDSPAHGSNLTGATRHAAHKTDEKRLPH